MPGLFVALFLRYDSTAALKSSIRRLLPVQLAVERFEREQGHLPQRIEELIPRYLEQIPAPRIGDEPLHVVYGHGSGFLLSARLHLDSVFRAEHVLVGFRSDGRDPTDAEPDRGDSGSYHGWNWVRWREPWF